MFPEKVINIMNSGKSVLYAWRKYRGYSQAKMARLLGITQSGYAQINYSNQTA
jgi:transcriptional regulator with XRE-family HTH domain